MAAAGPFGLGAPELIIILVVVMLIFGVGKLADVGGALGRSIKEFRRAAREPEEPEAAAPEATPAPSNARRCTNCGADLNAEAKFCARCGAPTQAAVN